MTQGDAAPIETVPVPLPWPPRTFDFEEAILRASNVHFERNPDGETSLIRRIGRVRIVVDFDRLHTFAPVLRGSRDFHLLKLVPEALRFVERVAPFDPLPAQLWSDDPPPAPEAYLRTATARLLRVLAAHVEKSDRDLRRLPLERSLLRSGSSRAGCRHTSVPTLESRTSSMAPIGGRPSFAWDRPWTRQPGSPFRSTTDGSPSIRGLGRNWPDTATMDTPPGSCPT